MIKHFLTVFALMTLAPLVAAALIITLLTLHVLPIVALVSSIVVGLVVTMIITPYIRPHMNVVSNYIAERVFHL